MKTLLRAFTKLNRCQHISGAKSQPFFKNIFNMFIVFLSFHIFCSPYYHIVHGALQPYIFLGDYIDTYSHAVCQRFCLSIIWVLLLSIQTMSSNREVKPISHALILSESENAGQ